MSTRRMSLVLVMVTIGTASACGGASQPGPYHATVEPVEEQAVAARTVHARTDVAVEGERFSFEDDVVEGDLVRPDGEMAMSGPAPAPTPAAAPPSGLGGADFDSEPAPMMAADEAPPAPRMSRRERRRARRDARSAAPTKAPAASPARASSGGSVAVAADLDVAAGEDVVLAEPIPEPEEIYQPVQHVARLTAASVGDVDRRGNYLSYLARHPSERMQTGLDMSRRVRFRVLDSRSRPVTDAILSFRAAGVPFEGRTHADGYWDFYPSLSSPNVHGQTQVTIQWGNHRARANVDIPAQGDARDIAIQLPQAVAVTPTTLDLAFVIDVTGSMGDELAYVTHEVEGIVEQVTAQINQANVRVAATFYRDRGDAQPLHQIDFRSNIAGFVNEMRRVSAGGGGDYPEDMNRGLHSALTTLSWTRTPAVRVLVVIADAPPQNYPDAQYTFHHAMQDASRLGIRILPVAASGADRVVEYLFRAMGAYTSTPYVYLTNDSGIGGHHMEADTDRISVEMFSELLTRLLIADMRGLGMHEPSHAEQGQGLVIGMVP